ncbi:hypothetical protein L1047_01070 [Synechococcus sp. Nb3U1]|uniref:hypothetical protein n=1 Tax=Synechococcus sp. Nb3U1 TaxID=1914529 RepID=UPI001F4619DA|nr:hypothetical protein [Synechococcus sp. Nb3U1]MCF2969787.1 hypothetical protein [Synechococcus sp. Nb3U1]
MRKWLSLGLQVGGVGILFWAQPSWAGCGFPRGVGNLFFSLQPEIFRPRTRFDEGGRVVSALSEFDETSLNVFAEAGLTDRLTLNVNTAYVFLENRFASGLETITQRNQGLQDVEVGLRYSWGDGDPFFSGQLTALIPPGYDTTSTPLPLGYGVFGYDLSGGVAVSGLVGSLPSFFDSCLTFRDYLGYPGNRIKANLTVGADLLPRLQTIVSLDGDFTLGNGAPLLLEGTPVQDPDYDSLKLSGQFNWRLDPGWTLGLGGFHYVSGRNTSAGGGITGYVWLSY